MMIEEVQGKLVVIILAAGKASRMNGHHKLLAHFDGVPLVRKIAIQALQSGVGPVVVVTGHRKSEIETALVGLPLRFAEAVDYASGISRSLAAGAAAAIDLHAQGAMIVLADMPGVTAEMMVVLAQTACHHGMTSVVRAGVNGKGGHPIVIPAQLFSRMLDLQGDLGARHLILESGLPVVVLDLGEASRRDVDTVAAVLEAGGQLTV